MIVVTTEEVTGHRIVEMKGQVFGLVVRSRGLGGNIMAFLRSLGGGEGGQNSNVSNARLARTAPLAWGDAPARDRRLRDGRRHRARQELVC